MQELDNNTRELLGIAKEDFWAYPGFVLLIAGCFFASLPIVLGFFALSGLFLLIYEVKSFPKYFTDESLSTGIRIYGILVNLALIGLQFVVVGGKLLYSFYL